MKKQVLITGGSKGIGAAIAQNLNEDYDIITVSRNGPSTEQGDLLDLDFRDYLVEKYTPDIFINNAACHAKTPYGMLETNGYVPVDLLLKFYDKLNHGVIINVGSLSAEVNIRNKQSLNVHAYALGKKLLKDTSCALAYSKNKPIKVMCISPAATDTDMLKNITDFKPGRENYDNYDWAESIAWTKPEEIADIVRFLINLPPYINVPEIVLDNHYSKAIFW